MSAMLNTNIKTLLAKCEELAKEEVNLGLLRNFITSVDVMIGELKNGEMNQTSSKVPEYEKRLLAIKEIINYTDNPSADRPKYQETNTSDNSIKEVRQLRSFKQHSDLRQELFYDPLRRRNIVGSSSGAENMNEAVKYYNQAQDKITDHMLALTRSLKEQTETANRIIKKDTEIVSKSTGMTDKNITSLHKETEKLGNHSRNAWKCWMWMMIVFVIITFIGMVLFMKIMKKKKV